MALSDVHAGDDLKMVDAPDLVLVNSLFKTSRPARVQRTDPRFPGAPHEAEHETVSPWEHFTAHAPRAEARRSTESLQQSIDLIRPVAGAEWSSLQGNLEFVGHDRIEGWAIDLASPDQAVELVITDNRRLIGVVLANRPARDGENRSANAGNHGFSLVIAGGLATDVHHLIEVRRTRDNCELPGSPKILRMGETFA
jgi:hypothetical protein